MSDDLDWIINKSKIGMESNTNLKLIWGILLDIVDIDNIDDKERVVDYFLNNIKSNICNNMEPIPLEKFTKGKDYIGESFICSLFTFITFCFLRISNIYVHYENEVCIWSPFCLEDIETLIIPGMAIGGPLLYLPWAFKRFQYRKWGIISIPILDGTNKIKDFKPDHISNVIKMLNIKHLVGHSLGTFIIAYYVQHINNKDINIELIDPVCFPCDLYWCLSLEECIKDDFLFRTALRFKCIQDCFRSFGNRKKYIFVNGKWTQMINNMTVHLAKNDLLINDVDKLKKFIELEYNPIHHSVFIHNESHGHIIKKELTTFIRRYVAIAICLSLFVLLIKFQCAK